MHFNPAYVTIPIKSVQTDPLGLMYADDGERQMEAVVPESL